MNLIHGSYLLRYIFYILFGVKNQTKQTEFKQTKIIDTLLLSNFSWWAGQETFFHAGLVNFQGNKWVVLHTYHAFVRFSPTMLQ